MLNDEQLAKLLLQHRLLDEKGLRNARERQRNVEKESLEESLLFLGLVDYQKLGKAYAHFHKLPYAPIFHQGIPAEAKQLFPPALVQQLLFLPLEITEQKLLLVTCDPDNEELRQRLETGRPTTWLVASKAEMTDAISTHYLGKKISREKREIELPFEFRILDRHPEPETTPENPNDDSEESLLERKRVILIEPDHRLRNAIVTLLGSEGYRVTAVIDSEEATKELLHEDAVYILQRRTFLSRSRELELFLKEHHRRAEIRYFGTIGGLLLGEELSPEELFRNYLSTVKLLVSALTRQNPQVIDCCHLTAHYARLLATGLSLKRKSQEGLLLAIYLKEIGPYASSDANPTENNILSLIPLLPYEGSAAVLKEIEDSFGLAETIAKINQPYPNSPLEARIITLLLWLIEEFGNPEGEGLTEISAGRFQERLSQDQEQLIDPQLAEELFQIIVHEQHLTGRSHSRGLILVIDPSFEREQRGLHIRLIRESYEIVIVSHAEQARLHLRQQSVCLLISEIANEQYDGITFCRELKREHPDLPFVFFTGEHHEETVSQALLAGADDFINKESSPQVTFLKMTRLIKRNRRSQAEEREGGVSGALEEMGFMETIQILANREKDALISLRNPENREAEVFLHLGEIIHARCGKLEGENAIYELLGWQKGFFQVTTPTRLPERNVFGSTEAIMLEGCRLLDENQREGKEILSGH
jgi:DNA-binding response OmpR family regulator